MRRRSSRCRRRKPGTCTRTSRARPKGCSTGPRTSWSTACLRWHPFFENAYSGGGFTLGAGYAHHVSPYNIVRCARQLHDPGLQAHRGGVHRAAAVPSPRLACRFSAAGARRPRSASTASAWTPRWTTATNFDFQQPYGSAHPDVLADPPPVDAARRRRAVAVVAAARRGELPIGRRRSTRLRPCPASAPRPPICIRRAPSGSTGAPRPAIRDAAASTASRCTITPTRTSSSASGRSTTRRSSTFRSCAKPGSSRCAAWPRPPTARTISRSRSSCCRRSAADRRCAASAAAASATRTACSLQAEWRIMVNRFIDTAFFYDAGKVAARRADLDFDGLKSDYGFGVRFHGPLGDAAAHRSGQESRRAGAHLRVDRDILRLPAMAHIIIRVTCTPRQPPDPAGRRARRCSPAPSRPTGPHFYPDDPIAREPESQDASKAQPYEIGSLFEMANNLFVTAGYKPSGTRAQNINTIDEVPDSNWFTNRIGTTAGHGRRDRARSQSRRRARPVALGADPGEDRRRPSGLHGEGCQRRDLVPRVRSAAYSRKGRPAAVEVATKIFWAFGYNQVESFLTTFDPKRVEIDPKATIRRPSGAQDPVHAGRHQRHPRARRAQRRRDLSRHRRPADSRQDPRRLPV